MESLKEVGLASPTPRKVSKVLTLNNKSKKIPWLESLADVKREIVISPSRLRYNSHNFLNSGKILFEKGSQQVLQQTPKKISKRKRYASIAEETQIAEAAHQDNNNLCGSFDLAKLNQKEGDERTLEWSNKSRKRMKTKNSLMKKQKQFPEPETPKFIPAIKQSKSLNTQGSPFQLPSSEEKLNQSDRFWHRRKIQINDFKIGKKLGSGSFGEVYLAIDKVSGFVVALKRMKKTKIISEMYVDQVVRQILIQFFLKHKNVTELYGIFDDDLYVYMILEFCPDGHLFNHIKQRRRLDETESVQVLKDVCQGIQALHREMVLHRDLKPQNILLSFGVPKISDFGWAVHRHNGELRDTLSGSPLYHSPQRVKKKQYDQKVDIWAIGILAFQCLTGMTPFKVYSFMNLNRIVEDEVEYPDYISISNKAKSWISSCLSKKAEERLDINKLLRHPFLK